MASQKNKWLILISFFCVYLFWGGTYLGMKFALVSFPPFIMAGIRHTTAGIILSVIALIKKETFPTKKEILNAGLVGALLLLGGNGLVAYAEMRVPSSIASLIIASVPLWISGLNWISGDKKNPSLLEFVGLFLGFAGIIVLAFQGSNSSTNIDEIGIALLLIASLSWSIGSLYSKRANMPKSSFYNISFQMLVGGFLLLIFSMLLGEYKSFNVSNITTQSLFAMFYLILFGSILAYSAYIWLFKNVNPTLASTYAFVNPVVALILGWSLASEVLSTQAIIASILIIGAVVILTLSKRKA